MRMLELFQSYIVKLTGEAKRCVTRVENHGRRHCMWLINLGALSVWGWLEHITKYALRGAINVGQLIVFPRSYCNVHISFSSSIACWLTFDLSSVGVPPSDAWASQLVSQEKLEMCHWSLRRGMEMTWMMDLMDSHGYGLRLKIYLASSNA